MSEVPEPTTSMSQDEKMWGMLCHLSALSGYLTGGLGFIVGPLIVWLIKKDLYPFVSDQGKESLNFQISLLIYAAAAFILSFVLIGIPLLIAIGIAQLVLVIMASIAANNGTAYRYPLTIRFIK